VWSGAGDLLADTTAALRVDRPDDAPSLWIPTEDVHFERLEEVVLGPTVGAPIRAWVLRGVPDRTSVASTHPLAADDAAWAAGLLTFDHDLVRVDLVDAVAGAEDRDVTVKRFPNWGDAADLIALLDVRQDGEGRWVSGARGDWRRPVVEASQLLGQTIVAATRHTGGRRVVSAHLVFPRAADARQPLSIELDELSAGRSFTTVAARVRQGDRICASGSLLLDATTPDVVRHAEPPPPAVAGPYDSEPLDMGVTGRDLRVVDGAYTSDRTAPVGPPVLDAWVRFRDVPADPALHAGLLAQFTGHLSIAAALRPHPGIGQEDAHLALTTGINAIGLSLHADVRADRWLLYHHQSTFAGDGMTHAECRIHDEAGALVASFSVDAMVRPYTGAGPADPKTSL
jgi:acyl-CoA thioesterase